MHKHPHTLMTPAHHDRIWLPRTFFSNNTSYDMIHIRLSSRLFTPAFDKHLVGTFHRHWLADWPKIRTKFIHMFFYSTSDLVPISTVNFFKSSIQTVCWGLIYTLIPQLDSNQFLFSPKSFWKEGFWSYLNRRPPHYKLQWNQWK